MHNHLWTLLYVCGMGFLRMEPILCAGIQPFLGEYPRGMLQCGVVLQLSAGVARVRGLDIFYITVVQCKCPQLCVSFLYTALISPLLHDKHNRNYSAHQLRI